MASVPVCIGEGCGNKFGEFSCKICNFFDDEISHFVSQQNSLILICFYFSKAGSLLSYTSNVSVLSSATLQLQLYTNCSAGWAGGTGGKSMVIMVVLGQLSKLQFPMYNIPMKSRFDHKIA
jgi:hypothetical protein